MAAAIFQQERPQLVVLTLLGLRQASLLICNSNGWKNAFRIHFTNYFAGI
jgi:hypothetical protein